MIIATIDMERFPIIICLIIFITFIFVRFIFSIHVMHLRLLKIIRAFMYSLFVYGLSCRLLWRIDPNLKFQQALYPHYQNQPGYINSTSSSSNIHRTYSLQLSYLGFRFDSPMVDYDHIDFIHGTKAYLSQNLKDHTYMWGQEQLILDNNISSIDQNIITVLGNVKIYQQARDSCNRMHASKNYSHTMYLKEQLSRFSKST